MFTVKNVKSTIFVKRKFKNQLQSCHLERTTLFLCRWVSFRASTHALIRGWLPGVALAFL